MRGEKSKTFSSLFVPSLLQRDTRKRQEGVGKAKDTPHEWGRHKVFAMWSDRLESWPRIRTSAHPQSDVDPLKRAELPAGGCRI